MEASAAHLKRFGLVTAALVLAAAALGVLLLTAAVPDITPAHAAAELKEWVLVANYTSTLSVIDPATDEVYGPFLAGQLGSEGGGVFDITVTPDGKTALISNFGDSVISFVDVSNPIAPSFIASVTLPMFAEDIAMAPNGQFAMVTDGGFTDLIAVLDVPAHTLAYTITLPALYANAIEIARDGTAVAADYFAGRWISLYPDTTGQYTVTGVYSYSMTYDGQVVDVYSASGAEAVRALSHDAGPRARPVAVNEILPEQGVRLNQVHMPRPVNVSIGPDGQTVLSGDVSRYNDFDDPLSAPPLFDVAVYRITGPGTLAFSGVITEMTRAGQSIAFSPDGHKAYLSGNGGIVDGWESNHLSVLDILAPGVVRLSLDNAADYPRYTSSQLFGVDHIVVVNGKAYLGTPTISGAEYAVRVVDLSDFTVKRLDWPVIPVGTTVIRVWRIHLPLAQKMVQ